MPPRVMLVAPLYAAVSIYLLMQIFTHRIMKYVLTITAMFMVLFQSATAIEINQIAVNAQQFDMAMMQSVCEDIAELGYGFIPSKPVALTGMQVEYSSPLNAGDSNMGYSYFYLGKARLQNYFEVNGYSYRWCEGEMMNLAEEEALTMPSWPEEGSVVEKEDYIIVNLGIQ